ncbi:hypothetical protein ACOSQ4_031283 [Xanthoceras sorbifolium]
MNGIATGVNIKEETMKKNKGGGKNKGKIPLAIHPVPIDVMEETSVLQQLHRDVITAKNREKVLSQGKENHLKVDSGQAPCVEGVPVGDRNVDVDVAVVASNLKEVMVTITE